MKLIRTFSVFLFLALAGLLAFASPLAQASPAAGVVVGVGLVFGGLQLISDVRFSGLAAISVPSALKLDQILQGAAIKALKRQLIPLLALSTVFRDVPLKGTDQVQVPFIPLAGNASIDFDYDVGYEAGNGTLQTIPIQITKRKYQTLGITSYQLARQPILELEEIIVKMVEKLAEDVITDIFSQVTPTGFPGQLVTLASGSWDSDTIGDTLRQAASALMWPKMGRSLITSPAVDGALFTDSAFKAAYAYGENSVIKDGELPRAFGFNYASAPVFPDNGVNLNAFAALKYAILTAFAPIPPTRAVRSVMVDYRTATDAETGLTLEYRLFGSAQGDTETHTIEVNYGSAIGDPAQLIPCVSE
jgi:hypothetical protein